MECGNIDFEFSSKQKTKIITIFLKCWIYCYLNHKIRICSYITKLKNPFLINKKLTTLGCEHGTFKFRSWYVTILLLFVTKWIVRLLVNQAYAVQIPTSSSIFFSCFMGFLGGIHLNFTFTRNWMDLIRYTNQNFV